MYIETEALVGWDPILLWPPLHDSSCHLLWHLFTYRHPVLHFEHVGTSCSQVSLIEILSELIGDKDDGSKDSFLVNIGPCATHARKAVQSKQEVHPAKVGQAVIDAGHCRGSHYTSSCKKR